MSKTKRLSFADQMNRLNDEFIELEIRMLRELLRFVDAHKPTRHVGSPLDEIHKALFEPEESDAYDNLDGARIDIERLSEQGKPTDAVCIRTIRRVLTQLNAVHNVFSALSSTECGEGK